MTNLPIQIEQISRTIRLSHCPANVRISRWFQKSKFTSVCPLYFYWRLSRWAFGSSLFNSVGSFIYERGGKEIEVKFNGRNAQFHALYEKYYACGYELETAALLLRLASRGGVFYDIGSNWGYFSLLVAALPNFKGQIYAFEPNPRTFIDLKSTVTQTELDGCVTPLNYGLGSKDGVLTLVEADSFNTGLARLTSSGEGPGVPVHRLDSLNLEPPSLIKLDAEFMEKDILEGGKELIQRHHPHIVFENFLSPENPSQTYDTLNLLESWGYRLFNPTLLFKRDDLPVLGSYGDDFSALMKIDPNPQTMLFDITTNNRFLMRGQLNVFACHETRLNELTDGDGFLFPND
jgi:FkbM family methyltransferase